MNHSHTLRPLTRALRERAYQEALDDTSGYVERRWEALPTHIRELPSENWAEFQALPQDDQRAVFEHHVKRGVVLALDRALQIAEATVPDIDLDMTHDD
ncbi:MAG: hypothetical protein M3457_21885 [Chloroflexota bacterium]|nr:hypothetical protein [Chloroflexota bacterium]